MNKEFKSFNEANQYAKEMRAVGYGAWVEEFYGLEGRHYTVLVWEKG